MRPGLISTVLAAGLAVAPAAAQQPAKPSAEIWQILAAIESNRPVIAPRALTQAEQSEAKRLAAAYKGAGQTSATLARLKHLAESGDRAAMLAMREAVLRGPPNDFRVRFADTPETREFMTALTDVMGAVWTAHVWDMHGFEKAGVPLMKTCHRQLVDDKGKTTATLVAGGTQQESVIKDGPDAEGTALGCGFRLTGKSVKYNVGVSWINQVPRGVPTFGVHYFNGANYYRKEADDFFVTGAEFYPVWGDDAFLSDAFARHLAARRNGLLSSHGGQAVPESAYSANLKLTMPWFRQYAAMIGQPGALEAANSVAAASAKARSDSVRESNILSWKAMMADYRKSPAGYDTFQLSIVASSLGGTYWTEFQAVAAANRPAPAPGQPSTGGVASSNPSQQVEVRTYDQTGAYVGSTTTSAFWADVMKMTSSAPR